MSLIRKTGANLLGFVVPMLVGFACFPVLIEQFGVERFGLITLMWVLVSYSGIVDMGLSRAIVLEVGAASGARDDGRIFDAVAFAHGFACLIGLVIGLSLVGAINLVDLLGPASLDGRLLDECLGAAPLLAIALPFVAGSAVLRGEMEGRQEFGWANLLRAATGTAIFLVPVATRYASEGLVAVAFGFLVIRVLVWFVSWATVRRLRRGRVGLWSTNWREFRRMIGVGGWLTVSYVLAPVMAYVDRFVLLSVAGAAAVAAYATANEVVTKLWLLPTAATAVLLPEFSRRISLNEDMVNLLIRAQRVVFFVMVPLLMAMQIFAPSVLRFWLGDEFGTQVEPLLTVLCVGMMISCLSQAPATACLSLGAARGIAVLQTVLLIVMVPLLMLVVVRWGAAGAAWIWVGRILVDQIGILIIVGNRLPRPVMGSTVRESTILSLAGMVLVGVAGFATSSIALAAFALTSLLAASVLGRELTMRWRSVR